MANERIAPPATHIALGPVGSRESSREQSGPAASSASSPSAANAHALPSGSHAAQPVRPAQQPHLRRRIIDGALQAMQPRPGQRTLAVVTGRTPLLATQAHALPGPDAVRHQARADATAPALIRPLRQAALASPFAIGRGATRSGDEEALEAARAWMNDAGSAKDALRALFGRASSAAAASAVPPAASPDALESLLAALLPEHGASDPQDAGSQDLKQRTVLGTILSIVSAQDPVRAHTLLRALDTHDTQAAADGAGAVDDTAVRRDVFAAQRLLAASGVGVDVLLGLHRQIATASVSSSSGIAVAHPPAEDSAEQQDIRRQATMTAYESAAPLLKAWPRGVRPPDSLEELMQVCNHLTDTFSADRMPGELPDDFRRTVSHDETASLLSNTDDTTLIDALANSKLAQLSRPGGKLDIPLRAFVAACQLRDDPAFDLSAYPDLQLPYLAARNHIVDASTLDKVAERFFKLLTYADRAAEVSPATWLEEITGRGKDPLAGLPRGAAGQMLREPEEDFAKLQDAFAPLIARLDATVAMQMSGDAGGHARPPSNAITASVRAEVLETWLEHMGQSGWQDRMSLGTEAEDAILRRAENALGMAAGDLQHDPAAAFVRDLALNARHFREWAADAGMDATFDPHLAHVDHMRNRGDTLTPRITPDDYLFGVRDVIDGTRMTYGARFSQTKQRGINANVSAIVNRPRSSKTVLPAAVPVAAVGPAVRLARTTGATVNAGSSALAGALELTTARGVSGWAGISGIASWTLWKSFGPSAGATLLPIIADVTRFSGAAVRSRIHHGTDLERWRTILLSAFDAMYGTDAQTRTVNRPADAKQMMTNLARAHHTNPYISFGPISGGTVTIAHSLSFNGALRGRDKKSGSESKGGGGISLTATVASFSRRRTQDDAGVIATNIVNRNANASVTVAGNLGVSMPAALTRDSGAVFAPVNLGTASAVLFPYSRGGTFRFSMENGKIAPTTIYDTEFANVGDFRRYTDSRRAEWLAWTGSRADPAAVLDDYLTRVEANGTTGKLLLAERVVLQPAARERLDFLMSMRTHVDNTALPQAAREEQQNRLGQAIDAELAHPDSWGPRFLYVLESNGTQAALGMSYWIEYLNVQENASNRQLSAYRADPTPS